MNLYLIQHGKAKSKEEDPERSLSDQGLEEVQKVSAWSARMGLSVGEIRHSGKKRAEQTAEIFAEKIKPNRGIAAVTGLGPMDDVNPVAEALNREEENLMLIGHLPFLSRLTSRLITGDPDIPIVRFGNAGIVCLIHEDSQWIIDWYVTPAFL